MSEVIDEGFSVDPNIQIYSVYILTDSKSGIIGVESTAFHTVEELENAGYVKLDEGTDGRIYGHAQPNYLREKYGKPTYDEKGMPNFKYADGIIAELTEEEKTELYPPAKTESSSDLLAEIEELKAKILMLESEVK